MILSKCCDAEVKFGMVDDRVGHGMHEETECANCGDLYPEVYDDTECAHKKSYVAVRHVSGVTLIKCSDCGQTL